jgi:hypothetical protein
MAVVLPDMDVRRNGPYCNGVLGDDGTLRIWHVSSVVGAFYCETSPNMYEEHILKFKWLWFSLIWMSAEMDHTVMVYSEMTAH